MTIPIYSKGHFFSITKYIICKLFHVQTQQMDGANNLVSAFKGSSCCSFHSLFVSHLCFKVKDAQNLIHLNYSAIV